MNQFLVVGFFKKDKRDITFNFQKKYLIFHKFGWVERKEFYLKLRER